MNLALNNLQRLICHKTQPTNLFVCFLFCFVFFFGFWFLVFVCLFLWGRAYSYISLRGGGGVFCISLFWEWSYCYILFWKVIYFILCGWRFDYHILFCGRLLPYFIFKSMFFLYFIFWKWKSHITLDGYSYIPFWGIIVIIDFVWVLLLYIIWGET